jgi:hypothetical protein
VGLDAVATGSELNYIQWAAHLFLGLQNLRGEQPDSEWESLTTGGP